MPVSAMSTPDISSSSETRMPIVAFRISHTTSAATNTQAKMPTMPISWPSRVASPLLNTTAITPQMPQVPWTLMAPTGSSMRSLSKATMEPTTMRPPTAPMTIDQNAEPESGSAVIATRPANAPFSAIVKSALPNQARARISAATRPPQAAMLVFTNTCATAFASSTLEIFSSEPPLKPNQPNQSTNMPSVAKGMLQPGIAWTWPFGPYLPLRGPSRMTPAKAAAAPHRWTMPEPAKSE